MDNWLFFRNLADRKKTNNIIYAFCNLMLQRSSHPRADLSGKENKLGDNKAKRKERKWERMDRKVQIWKRDNGCLGPVCHRPTSRVPYGIHGGYSAIFVRAMQTGPRWDNPSGSHMGYPVWGPSASRGQIPPEIPPEIPQRPRGVWHTGPEWEPFGCVGWETNVM